MRRLGVLIGLCVTVGCNAAPVAPPPEVLTLRNPTAPIGSQVDVTARDLAGSWVVRQGRASLWPLTVGRIDVQQDGADLILSGPAETPVRYAPIAPGRWALDVTSSPAPGMLPPEIWVYWMDFDRRTVTMGDPNGHFVAILDRSPTGGEDRITAARDILDWYGYDLSQMTEGE